MFLIMFLEMATNLLTALKPISCLFRSRNCCRSYSNCWTDIKLMLVWPVHQCLNWCLTFPSSRTDTKVSPFWETYATVSSLIVEFEQLPAGAKVFGFLIYEPFLASASKYISNNQHGFMPKRSATTNLMQFVSSCYKSIDDGVQVDAIYTDIKGGFW